MKLQAACTTVWQGLNKKPCGERQKWNIHSRNLELCGFCFVFAYISPCWLRTHWHIWDSPLSLAGYRRIIRKEHGLEGFRNQSHPANFENLILFWQVMLQKVDKLICATCDTHIFQQTDILLCFNLRSLISLFRGQKFTFSSFGLVSRERTQAAQFAHFLLQFALGREDVIHCSSPINTTVDAPSLNTWLIYYIYVKPKSV